MLDCNIISNVKYGGEWLTIENEEGIRINKDMILLTNAKNTIESEEGGNPKENGNVEIPRATQ